MTQQENFSHFDEIAAQYDLAKENVAIAEKAEAEAEAKRLEEEKAELERRKAEKLAKRSQEKQIILIAVLKTALVKACAVFCCFAK